MPAADKAALRRLIQGRRRALPPEVRAEKSERIIRNLVELAEYQRARFVFCYLSQGDEAATDQIIRQQLAAGQPVAVPVTRPDEGVIVPSRLDEWEGMLVTGAYNIREPAPVFFQPVAPTQIDLVLVPGVVFDRRGNRIGYGKGYFDRFLRSPGLRAPTVALAFDLQIVSAVAAEAHDVPVDIIVTETEVIYSGNLPRLNREGLPSDAVMQTGPRIGFGRINGRNGEYDR